MHILISKSPLTIHSHTNHQSTLTNHISSHPIKSVSTHYSLTHQSPITNHQSLVHILISQSLLTIHSHTNHQSPVINHQSPITLVHILISQSPLTIHSHTNHQSPITNSISAHPKRGEGAGFEVIGILAPTSVEFSSSITD